MVNFTVAIDELTSRTSYVWRPVGADTGPAVFNDFTEIHNRMEATRAIYGDVPFTVYVDGDADFNPPFPVGTWNFRNTKLIGMPKADNVVSTYYPRVNIPVGCFFTELFDIENLQIDNDQAYACVIPNGEHILSWKNVDLVGGFGVGALYDMRNASASIRVFELVNSRISSSSYKLLELSSSSVNIYVSDGSHITSGAIVDDGTGTIGVVYRGSGFIDNQTGFSGSYTTPLIDSIIPPFDAATQLPSGGTVKFDPGFYRISGTGSYTVTLPIPNSTHRGLSIVVVRQVASAGKITFSLGGNTVNGKSTYEIDKPYFVAWLVWTTAGWLDLGGYDNQRQNTLTDQTTITIDGSVSLNNELVLDTGGGTLAAPINVRPGDRISLAIQQDSGGGKSLTFDAVWNFAGGAPTVTSSGDAKDFVEAYVRATASGVASDMFCTISQDLS